MPVKIQLENPPVGFCMNSVQPGQQAQVLPRGFFTSDDGAILYTYLDSLFAGLLGHGLRSAGVMSPPGIDNCLVNIVDGTDATIWINVPTVLHTIAKTAVQAGTMATNDNIADVRSIEFRGLELPTRGAIAYTFQHGWRRALYFDFSMHAPNEDRNRPLDGLAALLGSLHAAVIFRERIQMRPEVLSRMFEAGWFPFIRLTDDLAMGLYRHFQEGWDHAPIEAEIVRVIGPLIPSLLAGWAKKPAFAPHIGTLSIAVRHFERGEYAAASALALPKVEGVLRTLNLGRGPAHARQLRDNLLARVRAQVSGATAFLPEAFVQYLEDYYYAGFDLDANQVPPSRNAYMHGVGPDAVAATPGFCLRLLLTIDQLFFYV